MAGIHAPGVFVGGVLCTDFGCLCAQKEGGECSKQEVAYEAKFKDLPIADIQSRLKLLSASLAKSGKDDVWMKRASLASPSSVSTPSADRASLSHSHASQPVSAERVTILKLLASIRAAEEAPAADEKQEL